MDKHRLLGSSLKFSRLVAINLLVLLVLLEIASIGFYFSKTRDFFYTTNKDRIKASATQFEVSQPGREDWTLQYQLHPYFGFINRQAYLDLPFRKTSNNQFVIGVFGGSVALHLYEYELQHHILAKTLQRLPQLQNKEIVILKFCNPAHKQPQQLLTLSYFLSVGQELDMVVNIDGFNEVALSYLNNKAGIEVSMPNGVIVAPLITLANRDLSADELALSLEVLQLKSKLQNTLNRLGECRFATCYTLRWVQAKYFLDQYRRKSATLNQSKREEGKDSLVYLNRIEKPLNEPELLERTVDIWFNSAMAMNDLLASRKIPYFEFIQPNQYYSTNRQFSEDEKRIALSDDSPFKEGATKGYPKLLAKVNTLRADGVNVFSAVSVFDETRNTVYFDNCCHYSDLGNEVFSNYLAQNILTVLSTQPAFK
jgi:hypothetical protein